MTEKTSIPNERLLATFVKAIDIVVASEVKNELLQLNRKLERALSRRDQWRAKAHYYHDKLLEREERLPPGSKSDQKLKELK